MDTLSCDGTRGIIKRLVARENLQNFAGNTIDSVCKIMNFCISKIYNLKFWLVTKDTLSETHKYLEKNVLIG